MCESLKRLASATFAAEKLFIDEEKAGRFMTAPHQMLDMRTPADVAAESDDGLQRVERLFAGITHSLPV